MIKIALLYSFHSQMEKLSSHRYELFEYSPCVSNFYHFKLIMNITNNIYCKRLNIENSIIEYSRGMIEFIFSDSIVIENGNNQEICASGDNGCDAIIKNVILVNDLNVSDLRVGGRVVIRGKLESETFSIMDNLDYLEAQYFETSQPDIFVSGASLTIEETFSCQEIYMKNSTISCHTYQANSSTLIGCQLTADNIVGRSISFHQTKVLTNCEFNMNNIYINSSEFKLLTLKWTESCGVEIRADKKIPINLLSSNPSIAYMKLINVELISEIIQIFNLTDLYTKDVSINNLQFRFCSKYALSTIQDESSGSPQIINIDKVNVAYLKVSHVDLRSNNPFNVKFLNINNSEISNIDFVVNGGINDKCYIYNNQKDQVVYVNQINCTYFTCDISLSTRQPRAFFIVSSLTLIDALEIDQKIEIKPISDFLLNCKIFLTVNISTGDFNSIEVINGVAKGVTALTPSVNLINLCQNGHTKNMIFRIIDKSNVYGLVTEPIECNAIDCVSLNIVNATIQSSTRIKGTIETSLTLNNSLVINIYFECINTSGETLLIQSNKSIEIEFSSINVGNGCPDINLINVKLKIIEADSIIIPQKLTLTNSIINVDVKLISDYGIIELTSDMVVDIYSKEFQFNKLKLNNINLKARKPSVVSVSSIIMNQATITDIEFRCIGDKINLKSLSDQQTIKVKEISPETTGKPVELQLYSIKIVGSTLVTPTVRILNSTSSAFENMSFNIESLNGQYAEIVSVPYVDNISINRINCGHLIVSSFNVKSDTENCGRIEGLSLIKSTIDGKIYFNLTKKYEASIESDFVRTVNIDVLDVHGLTIKNINLETRRLIFGNARSSLVLKNSMISSNVTFQFTESSFYPRQPSVSISSNELVSIHVHDIIGDNLELRSVNLIGRNKDTPGSNVIINVGSINLVSSTLDKIDIDLENNDKSTVESSPSAQTISINNISTYDLELKNVNLIGLSIKAKVSGLKMTTSNIKDIIFNIESNPTSNKCVIESDEVVSLKIETVITTIFKTKNINFFEGFNGRIDTNVFDMNATKITVAMQVSLIGYANDNLPLTIRSDIKDTEIFIDIVEMRNSNMEPVPVELILNNIIINVEKEIDLNKLYLVSSKIPNFKFNLKGKDVQILGSNEIINVLDIETNGITLQDVNFNYLSTKTCILKDEIEGRLIFCNISLVNRIFFEIEAPMFTINAENETIWVNKMTGISHLIAHNVTINSNVIYEVTNCVLDLSNAFINDEIRFKYNVSEVVLNGKGNSEITITEIKECKNLIIEQIEIKHLGANIPFMTQNLVLKGIICLIDVIFNFNNGYNNGTCTIIGEGHKISVGYSKADIFKFNDILIDCTYLESKQIIMDKTILKTNLIAAGNNDFSIVDKSKYIQRFNLSFTNSNNFGSIEVDGAYIEIFKTMIISIITLLNGGIITGPSAHAKNMNMTFESIPYLNEIIQSNNYHIKMIERLSIETLNNDVRLESKNIEYQIQLDDPIFEKLIFIPDGNVIELRNTSTFDEIIESNIEKILSRFDFENTLCDFVFKGFQRMNKDLNIVINMNSVELISGTSPFIINFTENCIITSSSQDPTVFFGIVNFYGARNIQTKGNIRIKKGYISIDQLLEIIGYNSQMTIDEMEFTTLNNTNRKLIQSNIPVFIDSIYVLPCGGNNTEFSKSIAINNININLSSDSAECILPYLYLDGIKSEKINIFHNRRITNDVKTLVCNVSCLWNLRPRNDVMKNKIINFSPSEAGGNKIRAVCFDNQSYLYVPNEDTMQQAVWISRKQFIAIIISCCTVIGFMFISFIGISIFRYRKEGHKAVAKECRPDSDTIVL